MECVYAFFMALQSVVRIEMFGSEALDQAFRLPYSPLK